MTKVAKMGYMITCTFSKGYYFEAEGEEVLAIDNDSNITFQCSNSSQKITIETILEQLTLFRAANYDIEEVIKMHEVKKDCANESE